MEATHMTCATALCDQHRSKLHPKITQKTHLDIEEGLEFQ